MFLSAFFFLTSASAESPPTTIVYKGVLRYERYCPDELLADDAWGVCKIEVFSDPAAPTERTIQMSLESESRLWTTILAQSHEIAALKAEIERLKAKN